MMNFAAMVEAEQQTRDLVEGYDYLKELSSQAPRSYQEMANYYREQMVNAASIISPIMPAPEDTKENLTPEQNLNMLRMELQSISHERVIVEVLTRQTMIKSKLQCSALSSSSMHSTAHVSSGGSSYRITPQSVPAAALNEVIPIPEYNPGATLASAKDKTSGTKSSSTSSSSRYAPVVRKLLPGSVMVPSLRQGSLPPELQALRSVPSVPAAPVVERRARAADSKRPRTQVALQGFTQAVRSFKTQLASSQSDLEALKSHVDSNLNAEKAVMNRQLKQILSEVRKQQEDASGDLLGHVDRAVDAAMGKLANLIKPLADQRLRASHAQQQALEAAMRVRVQAQVAATQAQTKALERERAARQAERASADRDRTQQAQEREREKVQLRAKIRVQKEKTESHPPPPPTRLHQQQQQQQQQYHEPRKSESQVQTQSSTGMYRVITPRSRSTGANSNPPYPPVAAAVRWADGIGTPSHAQTQPTIRLQQSQQHPVTAPAASSPTHSHKNQSCETQTQSQLMHMPLAVDTQLKVNVEDVLQLAGGDRGGVRWASLQHSVPMYAPSAPSIADLQRIPGAGPVSFDSVVHAAPAAASAALRATASESASRGADGVPLASLPHLVRQLGVISAPPAVVISGTSTPAEMRWRNSEAHSTIKRATLSTVDPSAPSFAGDDADDVSHLSVNGAGEEEQEAILYPIQKPTSGTGAFVEAEDGALEGPGAPFRGLATFLSRVEPMPLDQVASSAPSPNAAPSTYAQERHLGRTVERLLGSMVEGQRALLEGVVESQVRIAEELAEGRRATALAHANPASNAEWVRGDGNATATGAASGASGAVLSEERVAEIVSQCLEKFSPRVTAVNLTAGAVNAAAAFTGLSGQDQESKKTTGEIESRLSQALEVAAAAQAAAQAAHATAAAAAAAAREQSEVQLGQLEARLREQLESEVRRGVGEGVDEGVRRALAAFETAREANEPPRTITGALVVPIQQQEQADQTSTARAFSRVPLPFMNSSEQNSAVLETLLADAAESKEALKALRTGLAGLNTGDNWARGNRQSIAFALEQPKTGRGVSSYPIVHDDDPWLDGEEEGEDEPDVVNSDVANIAQVQTLSRGLPDRDMGSRASLKLEPEELSELYIDDEDGGVGEASWSAGEDDEGEGFIRRYVQDKLVLTDRAKANLRGDKS